jgi:hypothetical protein
VVGTWIITLQLSWYILFFAILPFFCTVVYNNFILKYFTGHEVFQPYVPISVPLQ